MSALSMKETRVVLKSLEGQGARLVKTTKGHRVLFPDGSSTSIHWTPSDHRSTLNLRSVVRRAAFAWPFDEDRQGNTMAIRLTKSQHAKVKRTVKAAAPGPTSAAAIAAEAGVSGPTARRALVDYGFVQERRGIWMLPDTSRVDAYPEIARAEAREVAAAAEVEPVAVAEPAAAVAEPVVVAEAEPAVVEPAVVEAEPAVVVPAVAEPDARPHEFIDDVGSWCIPVPADLQTMADFMGLRIEVRVWRDAAEK